MLRKAYGITYISVGQTTRSELRIKNGFENGIGPCRYPTNDEWPKLDRNAQMHYRTHGNAQSTRFRARTIMLMGDQSMLSDDRFAETRRIPIDSSI